MSRERQTATLAGLLLTVVLVGCTPVSHTHPTPAPSTTAPAAQPSPTATNGTLTADVVAEVAPLWQGGTFRGLIAAPDGYDYGGDCHDSAWTVLALTEQSTAVSGTFSATSTVRPAPTLVLAVLPLNPSDRAENLDALQHQVTSCTGVAPTGETLQEPAPEVAGWSGLHNVGDDEDLYWAAYDDGIAMALVSPGLATLTPTLASQAEAILGRQLEVLGAA